MLTYFCGTEPQCSNVTSQVGCRIKENKREEEKNSYDCQEALQKARLVVETQYSVVGVMEEFNTSLAVMEAYLPGTTKCN